MSKLYREKSTVVNAVVYRFGLEDGFSCIPFTSKCRWKDENGNYKQCEKCRLDVRKKPFILILGRRQYIDDGDYIIIEITGKKYLCKPDVFRETYEAVEVGFSKKTKQNEHRVCCICGSNETYKYRGDPKWYKKYDENGLWDGESYKCRRCYRIRYT